MSEGGIGPLELLAVALQRAGQSDEDETTDRPVDARYAMLRPPSTARLYGPHGLLADELPLGGSGEAAVLRADGEILARRSGPAVDFGRMPHAPLPDEAVGLKRAREARDQRLEEGKLLRQENEEEPGGGENNRHVGSEARPRDGKTLTEDRTSERRAIGIERYLDVDRGKLGFPVSLLRERGSTSYRKQDREDHATVHRKAHSALARETADTYDEK